MAKIKVEWNEIEVPDHYTRCCRRVRSGAEVPRSVFNETAVDCPGQFGRMCLN